MKKNCTNCRCLQMCKWHAKFKDIINFQDTFNGYIRIGKCKILIKALRDEASKAYPRICGNYHPVNKEGDK